MKILKPKVRSVTALVLLSGTMLGAASALAKDIPPVPGAPAIHEKPVLDTPQLLLWTRNGKPAAADLTDPTSNQLFDLHGDLNTSVCSNVDLVLSTEGNYHMALHSLWQKVVLPRYGAEISNWYYTTSPPVSLPQTLHNNFSIDNLYLHCRPSVAVASMRVIKKLEAAHQTEGKPIPIIKGRGNALLVKHGNPKHIDSVWDLRRPDVRLVTPNPYNEPGAFLNYATTIYEIAAHDPHPPKGWTADRLFNAIFNSHVKDKWLYGARIHHRDEPWSVAYGRADVAVIMYQLGAYTVKVFPSTFSLVPLGGTVSDPKPLPGNVAGESYLVKIKGPWTHRQRVARQDVIKAYESPAFTRILVSDGLTRP
ncbi:MAG: substrate-binding domain-containing protein [Acidiferrobacterales bacterium]